MNSIRISHIGLSEWESVFVQTTVNISSGIDIASWRYVDEPASADVLLVPSGRADIALPKPDGQGELSPDQPITQELTTPVTYPELIALLRDLEQKVRSVVESHVPGKSAETSLPRLTEITAAADVAVKPDSAADKQLREKTRPARRFVEGTRFLGILQDVLRNGGMTEITHPDYPAVNIFPAENAYTSVGDPMMLSTMFRASSQEFFRRNLNDVIASVILSIDQRRPLFQLVYCAALFGSEGRLLPHANPDDVLFLVDEPDFGSIPYTTEHRELARQMLAGPAKLSIIAESTNIDIDTVIDFCNACEASGLIRRGASSIAFDLQQDEAPGNSGDSQLLGQVRHLFRAP